MRKLISVVSWILMFACAAVSVHELLERPEVHGEVLEWDRVIAYYDGRDSIPTLLQMQKDEVGGWSEAKKVRGSDFTDFMWSNATCVITDPDGKIFVGRAPFLLTIIPAAENRVHLLLRHQDGFVVCGGVLKDAETCPTCGCQHGFNRMKIRDLMLRGKGNP